MLLLVSLIACLIALAAEVVPAGAATVNGKPISKVVGGGIKPGPTARTIPFFADSFSFAGKTYDYTMVGTSPAGGATTTIPTVIQPLRVVFADGTVFDAASTISPTVASPLFQPASFASGVTQYGDAIQRAEFWNVGGSGSYNVRLSQPTILPTLTLTVPNGSGFTATTASGVTIGEVNIAWFIARIGEALNTNGFSPMTLPLFLSKDVLLYSTKPDNCCTFGFHGTKSGAGNGNGDQPIQTYAWASWVSRPVFPDASSIVNVNGLSHEISEWYNDPFIVNKVPTWSSPLAPQYGCSPYLEDGDPLVGVSFTVSGYSLQDEAFKSWFAHDVPSTGINGQYTYLGTFNGPSPLC